MKNMLIMSILLISVSLLAAQPQQQETVRDLITGLQKVKNALPPWTGGRPMAQLEGVLEEMKAYRDEPAVPLDMTRLLSLLTTLYEVRQHLPILVSEEAKAHLESSIDKLRAFVFQLSPSPVAEPTQETLTGARTEKTYTPTRTTTGTSLATEEEPV